MLYKVKKPFGKYKPGQIIDSAKERRVVKRKLEEGETIEEIKMNESVYENKSLKKDKKGG